MGLLIGFFPKVLLAGFLTLGWLWFIGGNLLFGIPQFEKFVRRSASSVPHIS